MPEEIEKYLTRNEPEMFSLLKKLVLIQSGTGNKKGVDSVGRVVQEFFTDVPLQCERFAQENVGDHLVFTTSQARLSGNKSILIVGHMDTVFPEKTSFNWYKEDTDKVLGPGVIDMKGGLVVTMFAVKALAKVVGLDQISLVLLFNSDEETGSATSTKLVEELAGRACCGLVTECGGLDGQVVTGRRGKTGYHLDVQGRAGHAAFSGREKASAILELCRLVPQIEGLNDLKRGLVVNVGRVEGGIGANTVAEHARAEIDTRFCTSSDGQILQKKIKQCVAAPGLNGTSASITMSGQRPVMEQTEGNKQLYAIIKQQADTLGISLCDEIRQGVSDGSNIAGQGIPVVDGLGPIGEYDHSDREYMLKESLLQRCQLLAASLVELNRINFSG
jgi:glutamate carboxypeptidase